MGKYVRIQTTKDITVYDSISKNCINKGNIDARVGDRLNVSQQWTRTAIALKTSKLYYPVEIKDWEVIKDLAADGIITVGGVVETSGDAEVDAENDSIASRLRNNEAQLKKNKKAVEEDRARGAKSNLDDTLKTIKELATKTNITL